MWPTSDTDNDKDTLVFVSEQVPLSFKQLYCVLIRYTGYAFTGILIMIIIINMVKSSLHSEQFLRFNDELKKRYSSKLTLLGGTDSYTLKISKLSDDIAAFSQVSFLHCYSC